MNKLLDAVRQDAVEKVNQYMDLEGINAEAITDLVLSIVNDKLAASGADKLLELPETYGSLEEHFNTVKPEYMITLIDRMRSIQSMVAAIGFKSVYLEERAEGCSHVQAARKANSARKKVRAAFGFDTTHDILI